MDEQNTKTGRPRRKPMAYVVTFEQETQAPRTVRGSVVAGSPHRGAYLAVRDAAKQAKGQRWSSLVVVLDKTGE